MGYFMHKFPVLLCPAFRLPGNHSETVPVTMTIIKCDLLFKGSFYQNLLFLRKAGELINSV